MQLDLKAGIFILDSFSFSSWKRCLQKNSFWWCRHIERYFVTKVKSRKHLLLLHSQSLRSKGSCDRQRRANVRNSDRTFGSNEFLKLDDLGLLDMAGTSWLPHSLLYLSEQQTKSIFPLFVYKKAPISYAGIKQSGISQNLQIFYLLEALNKILQSSFLEKCGWRVFS